MDIKRELVTIRTVSEIVPIEGADSIEIAKVDGWQCVVKKGEFKVGDKGIYFEIDSLLPTIPVFEFLAPRGTKKMFVDGKEIQGYRLRTIKLRGQLSQGLLLPVTSFTPPLSEVDDWTAHLGVTKYEAPIPAELAGKMKGSFPSWIQKTDQERCQNLVEDILYYAVRGLKFEVTEKLDGSSMTVYFTKKEVTEPVEGEEPQKPYEFGVCSRNMDLLESEGNTFWRVARELGLEEKMTNAGRSVAIQGELVGPGVQGNYYKLGKHQFRIFDVYDINEQNYMQSNVRMEFLKELGLTEDSFVPVIHPDLALGSGVEGILLLAEGQSALAEVEREGLVFKSVSPVAGKLFSFKAISNKFLLNEK